MNIYSIGPIVLGNNYPIEGVSAHDLEGARLISAIRLLGAYLPSKAIKQAL